jgi:EAL domain-containing protein (putative c-di-GMP-specific phosphodiesterase class I)
VVTDKVLKYIKEQNPRTSLALNLSGDFVKKRSNVQWLKEKLELFRRQSDLVLWFEVSNMTALHEIEQVSLICSMIKTFGYRFGIDHFILPEKGAYYLQVIRPEYIKANGTYLQDIMMDRDTGKNSESFNNLVRSLGISVIAMNIEEEKEFQTLQSVGIERFQGSYIAPVTLLK